MRASTSPRPAADGRGPQKLVDRPGEVPGPRRGGPTAGSLGLGVNTDDADMPSSLDLAAGHRFRLRRAADAQAARDSGRAGGVDESVSVGTCCPAAADAELTAWWLGGENADPKVDPSKVRAFSWDGSSLTELAVAVGEEPTGALGGAKLAQVSPEPGRAPVLVDTTSLTEKSQAKAVCILLLQIFIFLRHANQVLPGVQVYMQCSDYASDGVPVSRSATLTIAEDGTKTVHIEPSAGNEPADVSTLQQISGAPGETEIVSTPRIKEDHLFGTDMKTQSQVWSNWLAGCQAEDGRTIAVIIPLPAIKSSRPFWGQLRNLNMEVRLSS